MLKRNIMNRMIQPVHRLFATGAFLSLAGMIIVVGIQVFFRFFMEATPHWTEEAARMLFIYSVAFGTGTGITNGDFIRLNLIGKYLSPRAERFLHLTTDIIVTGFSVIIIFYSFEFVALGMDEKSPALQIPMGLVFFSMVIIGLAIFIFTLEGLFRTARGNSRN
jgi:TRAP-type transport system small permease protein